MFSDAQRPPEAFLLVRRNEVAEDVAILNERRRVALAEIDKASFS